MGLEFKNDIDLTSGEDGVQCPLVDLKIKSTSCFENAMIVSGFMDEHSMIEKFKTKENWKEICQNCKNYSF